ncbi:potassium channel, sub T, member 2 [Apophysomyces sp. BC1034]|nr:potassium channel, sub T, member 2 [Apophysomyces sp. BC1034]
MSTGPNFKNPRLDEENTLCAELTNNYGAIDTTNSFQDRCATSNSEPLSSKEENNPIPKQRKHHLQKKQSRPKLANLLSSRSGSYQEENESDFVLPALDPQAQEVIASMPSQGSFDHFLARRAHVNLSTVRTKYRMARKHARDEQAEVYSNIKHYFNYDGYMSWIKKAAFVNQIIVLFVRLDLLVDLFFCLAYLVEMKQESDVNLDPPWLYKWRSYDLCALLPSELGSVIAHQERDENQDQSADDRVWDPLKLKLLHLISTLVVLLYNGMAAFQYCEVTFGTTNYSILDSLYVVMVTLSTVGYGDITPNTQASRLVMMALIGVSLAVLPRLLTDVLETLRKQNDGGGHVSKGSIPFILIVGSFAAEQVNELLDGFLNTENAAGRLNVIFLDSNPPSEELKLMERNSMWGHRIQFLHGSVLKARYATAIFTISDHNATDPGKEDERNTVRLWSIYCYTVSNNVPIYTYNLSQGTAIYQKVAKEIVCVREFKQYLLAINCRCRGASTLLTNLLHQREPLNCYDEPWQAQYDDGSCNEIYMARAPACIVDINFGLAAWLLFKECQVILFAIKTRAAERDDYEILLNPSNHYTIKETDVCVYIAESPKEIRDIENLSSVYVWQTVRALQNQRTFRKAQQTPSPTASKTEASPTHSARSSISSIGATEQVYRICKLPSPKHALLTGSRSLISRLGKGPLSEAVEDASLPFCYLLDQPALLEDVLIESTGDMEGHILVCLHREPINLFKFVYNLRSPHLKPEELQDIVLLCNRPPKQKIFQFVNMFPKLYFMVGNCRHPDDLLRAGVKSAKQVVVMSEKECLEQYERNSDSPAIMSSHIMDLLLQERCKDSYTIVNLVEKSNIKYMHLLQGKDVAEEIDVFYTPAYAAGDVIADSMISNVLLSQIYYKPDIVSIIKTLCGMPGPLYEDSQSSPARTGVAMMKKAPHLTSVRLSPSFANQPFVHLFETLLLDYGVLPMGLLRAPDEEFGNELPFAYPNPVPSLILRETDMVYVLAPPGWKMPSVP